MKKKKSKRRTFSIARLVALLLLGESETEETEPRKKILGASNTIRQEPISPQIKFGLAQYRGDHTRKNHK